MHLQSLTKLEKLKLSCKKVSEKAFTYLEPLEHLTKLDLAGCDIVRSGWQHVTLLRPLKIVRLPFFCPRSVPVHAVRLAVAKGLSAPMKKDPRSPGPVTK